MSRKSKNDFCVGKSLADLGADYIRTYRTQYVTTKNFYQQMSVESAIESASHLQVRKKLNTDWKTHSHFRFNTANFRQSCSEAERQLLLVRQELEVAQQQGNDPFEYSFSLVKKCLEPITGLQGLAYYDITCLLGYHFNFSPKKVYLYRGALEGANSLFKQRLNMPFVDGKDLPIESFPDDIRSQLSPFEIEDFLCIYKHCLEAFTNDQIERIEKDWRGM
jgi:hypothetical protein